MSLRRRFENLNVFDLTQVERDHATLIQQTIRQLNTQFGRRGPRSRPMTIHRVKVTFKEEPGEGSGVARSFYTAVGEAFLSGEKLPPLEPRSKLPIYHEIFLQNVLKISLIFISWFYLFYIQSIFCFPFEFKHFHLKSECSCLLTILFFMFCPNVWPKSCYFTNVKQARLLRKIQLC